MADNKKSKPSPWTSSVTSLPPSKRYICTHNFTGQSIVHSSPAQLYLGRPGVGGAARSYATSSVPANLAADADIAAYLSSTGPTSHKSHDIVIPTGSGANLVVVDIGPGGESQMHRTVSIDFSICVLGTIKMELDGGEILHLNPGDHVIQRGTMHKWINGSQTEAARFIAVTLPCNEFEIPGTGKMLKEEFVKGTGAKKRDGSRL
ncbi:hypothetical protein BCR34DRAFT_337798 [Clohesyomyces aquaticus]|uniref:Cupin 2 conserved barrel domain-containing protein n=1 Tax=Clohesyomyces aquaticus TaxID=1231657 RepID=A0A1Y1ZLZ3_9PLEO|nr:hypothetical protein BCR34DRAFT_337798 [Clohesyomyces aquaticus]